MDEEDGFQIGQAVASSPVPREDDGFQIGRAVSHLDNVAGNEDKIPEYEPPSFAKASQFFISTLPKRVEDPAQPKGFRLALPGELRAPNGEPAVLYDPFLTETKGLDDFGMLY